MTKILEPYHILGNNKHHVYFKSYYSGQENQFDPLAVGTEKLSKMCKAITPELLHQATQSEINPSVQDFLYQVRTEQENHAQGYEQGVFHCQRLGLSRNIDSKARADDPNRLHE